MTAMRTLLETRAQMEGRTTQMNGGALTHSRGEQTSRHHTQCNLQVAGFSTNWLASKFFGCVCSSAGIRHSCH